MSRARASGIRILALPTLLCLVAAAPAEPETSHNDLLDELIQAAAGGDTATLALQIQERPDRVYLVTTRLADGALQKAHRAEGTSTEDFRAAALIAKIHGNHTGTRGLADLVELYWSFDREQIAQRMLADSLFQEGIDLSYRGEHARSIDVLMQAQALHQSLGDRKAEGLDLALVCNPLDATGQIQQARRHAARAIELEREIGFAAGIGSALHALGRIELKEGRLEQAIEAFRQAQQIGRALDDDNYVASSVAMLANAYYLAGRYHEALAMYEEGLALYRRIGYPRAEVAQLINMGKILSTDPTRHEEATLVLEEAIRIAKDNGYTLAEGDARYTLASVEFDLGRHQKAFQTVCRAISLFESAHGIDYLPNALAARGRFLRARGRLGEARQDLERAVSIAREGATPYALCEALVWLAFTEADLENPRGGLGHALEAIEIFEATRGQIDVEELRAGSLHLKMHVYEAALRSLWDLEQISPEAGHAVEAFHLVERCKSTTILDFLSERKAPDVGESRRTRANLAGRLSRLQLDLLTAPQKDAARDSISREIRLLRAQMDSLEMVVVDRGGGHGRGTALDADAAMQEFRGPDDLLLEFYFGREIVYGWALAAGQIRFFEVGIAEDVMGLVGILGSLLRDRARRPFDSPAYSQLTERLLGPISDLLRHADRVIVVPDGPLLGIPFETLPYLEASEDEKPMASGEKAWKYLIQDFEVCYAPSASLWRRLTALQASRPHAPYEIMAFGNPTLEQVVGGRQWSPLAYSSLELRELDGMFSPRMTAILSEDEASEDRLKAEQVGSHRMLHFATHAYAGVVDPSASGLLLAPGDESDGFLTLFEILGLDLRTDLVTLSACETGGGRVVSGEGVLGLSRAFFYAGTASVLASLWEVDDEHTARFMGRFYRHLAEGASKGEALSLVKREALSGQHGLSAHPYFWAPFVLMGDADGLLSLTPRRWYEQALVWPALGLALALTLSIGRVIRCRPGRARAKGTNQVSI